MCWFRSSAERVLRIARGVGYGGSSCGPVPRAGRLTRGVPVDREERRERRSGSKNTSDSCLQLGRETSRASCATAPRAARRAHLPSHRKAELPVRTLRIARPRTNACERVRRGTTGAFPDDRRGGGRGSRPTLHASPPRLGSCARVTTAVGRLFASSSRLRPHPTTAMDEATKTVVFRSGKSEPGTCVRQKRKTRSPWLLSRCAV